MLYNMTLEILQDLNWSIKYMQIEKSGKRYNVTAFWHMMLQILFFTDTFYITALKSEETALIRF